MRKNKMMCDPLIIHRVRQYLEENVHQTYVDVGIMAKQLQERYREYSRRKSGSFRMAVEQAYKTVLHSYGLDSNSSPETGDAEVNSDLELMDDTSNSNHLNQIITNMYTKATNKQSGIGKTNEELIDISSDESNDATKINEKSQGFKKSQNPLTMDLSKNLTVVKSATKLNNYGSGKLSLKNKSFDTGNFPPKHINKKRKLIDQPNNTNGQSMDFSHGNQIEKGQETHFKYKKSHYTKEVTIKSPDFSFGDIGGLDKTLKELCELLFHVKHPEVYHQIGLAPPRGFLLHGPPGCGKTLLAHAIAGQLKIGIIEVPATELICGISGESEERIRDIFEQAAINSPCVLFIDEIDVISSNRQNAQKVMESRIVAQLISSLDGLSSHPHGEQVVVIGATNRPELLDPALRRVGRFENEICIGIPDLQERIEILVTLTEDLYLQDPFDYDYIAKLTPGYVGADLLALSTRAASIAIKRVFQRSFKLKQVQTAKNIPIVDLVGDTSVVDEQKENSNATKQDVIKSLKEGVAEKVVEDNSGKIVENTSNNCEDKTQMNVDVVQEHSVDNVQGWKDNINLQSDETIKKVNCDESISKEMEIETETKDKQPKNEVFPASRNIEDDSINSYENNEEVTEILSTALDPIDVDDIPDKPLETVTFNQIPELTLNEILTWFNSDISPVDDLYTDDLRIQLSDFIEALKVVKPSSKREGFITVPDVTWNDIGSLKNIRDELQLAILAPVKYPEKLKILGLNSPTGVLLCGPPGCGKTLLAKAVANEAGINFISVKGPELMNMYVGESERAVRQCFQRARNSAPCVIFFDEFDSLCPKRSELNEGGSGTRVVNQLLTELDGIDERKGVFIMAATNRPDIVDPAVLRPGRFDTVLYVGLPSRTDRIEIIWAITKKGTTPPFSSDFNIDEIGDLTNYFTGADLAGLIRQASMLALKDSILSAEQSEELKVTRKNVLDALKRMKPSVSKEDREMYETLRIKYSNSQAEEGNTTVKF